MDYAFKVNVMARELGRRVLPLVYYDDDDDGGLNLSSSDSDSDSDGGAPPAATTSA
jgi:hypothetical protein